MLSTYLFNVGLFGGGVAVGFVWGFRAADARWRADWKAIRQKYSRKRNNNHKEE